MKRNEYIVQIGASFVGGYDEEEKKCTWVTLSPADTGDTAETAQAFKRSVARDIAKRFGGKVLTRTTTVTVH